MNNEKKVTTALEKKVSKSTDCFPNINNEMLYYMYKYDLHKIIKDNH